jgi:hypothetical protein
MRTEEPQTAVVALDSHGRGLWEGLRRRLLVQVAITEGVDVYLAAEAAGRCAAWPCGRLADASAGALASLPEFPQAGVSGL